VLRRYVICSHLKHPLRYTCRVLSHHLDFDKLRESEEIPPHFICASRHGPCKTAPKLSGLHVFCFSFALKPVSLTWARSVEFATEAWKKLVSNAAALQLGLSWHFEAIQLIEFFLPGFAPTWPFEIILPELRTEMRQSHCITRPGRRSGIRSDSLHCMRLFYSPIREPAPGRKVLNSKCIELSSTSTQVQVDKSTKCTRCACSTKVPALTTAMSQTGQKSGTAAWSPLILHCTLNTGWTLRTQK
jgi:hypothetical protein